MTENKHDIDPVTQLSNGLLDKLGECGDDASKIDPIMLEYLNTFEEGGINHGKVNGLEFPQGAEWFNHSALKLHADLSGKVVILDFFTYCCINCMHILPKLAKLEESYPPTAGVVTIGVHSAKFLNEKLADNIRGAVVKYDITHPCVNDGDLAMWNGMGVSCWPTFVVLGPEGQVIFSIAGEMHMNTLEHFVRVSTHFYEEKGRLNKGDLPDVSLEKDKEAGAALRYPSKLCVAEGDRLFVSDTANHRILQLDAKSGKCQRVIGGKGGQRGFKDGSFDDASFYCPQGITWRKDANDGGELLLVADTENHAIRCVDLKAETVTTVAGTGVQGHDVTGGGSGLEQIISSPWDVLFGMPPKGEGDDDVLWVAMAGTHQLWTYNSGTGRMTASCGSGAEENRNNSYPHKAGFAQPSGLAFGGPDNSVLYLADAESSTVRQVDVKKMATTALVGGEVDPTNLFGFGDVDGKARNAKLQHPLAVCFDPKREQVYVADSYNHKIKVINPKTKECRTMAGNGTAGNADGAKDVAQFSEPGGLALSTDGSTLFVADTNNSAIRLLDIETETVVTLGVDSPPATDGSGSAGAGSQKILEITEDFKSIASFNPTTFTAPPIQCNVGEAGEFRVELSFPPGVHLTDGAPSAWQVVRSGVLPLGLTGEYKGDVVEGKDIVVTFIKGDQDGPFSVEAMLYFCEEGGNCHMKPIIVETNISSGAGSSKAKFTAEISTSPF